MTCAVKVKGPTLRDKLPCFHFFSPPTRQRQVTSPCEESAFEISSSGSRQNISMAEPFSFLKRRRALITLLSLKTSRAFLGMKDEISENPASAIFPSFQTS